MPRRNSCLLLLLVVLGERSVDDGLGHFKLPFEVTDLEESTDLFFLWGTFFFLIPGRADVGLFRALNITSETAVAWCSEVAVIGLDVLPDSVR